MQRFDAGATDEWVVEKRRNVRVGDTTIEYEVLRSKRRRKTVRIAVNSMGVLVRAPMTTPNDLLQAFVVDQAPWILEHINDPPPETAPKRLTSGDSLPYLGRNMRVFVEPTCGDTTVVCFDHWQLKIAAPEAMLEAEHQQGVREAVMAWYKNRAAERLDGTVERWRARMGHREKPRVLIGNQRRLWGSCAFDGTLRFNWRLVMLKPEFMEYVAVHELAHLTHRNHSKSFWDLVEKFLPDAQQRRRLLRKAGLDMPL